MAVQFDAPNFYKKMKKTVVVVSVVLPKQDIGPSLKKSKKSGKGDKKRKETNKAMNPEIAGLPMSAMSTKCGGVLLDDLGTVLTCSQNIPDSHQGIYVAMFDEAWEKTFPADLIARHEESDLALIRFRRMRRGKNELNYAKVGLRAGVGMKAVMISHHDGSLYSFTTGMVAFPCRSGTTMCRTVGNLGELPMEVSKLDPKLPIIQISEMGGGCEGAAGAPVFNSEGLIIGIYSFTWKLFDFAIHFDAVRTFVEAHAPHVLRNGGSTSQAAVSDDSDEENGGSTSQAAVSDDSDEENGGSTSQAAVSDDSDEE